MNKKFPQQNYIYTGEKPKTNLGDYSIQSDSFNELEDGKENIDDINLSENYFEIPKESEIPQIHMPFNNEELFPNNKHGFFFCSGTKDTENCCTRINSNNKEDNFSIKNKFKINKENNRYNNINYLCKNNFRFLNSLQINNDYNSEDEDIVNNEISVNFTKGYPTDKKLEKENQIEIVLDNNFSKLSNKENNCNNISNNTIISNGNNINKNKINEIKKKNLLKKNEINDNIENIITNINKNKDEWNKNSEKKKIKNKNKETNKNIYNNNDNKYLIENKENIKRNGIYDTEININLNQLEKSNKIIKIDKSKIYNYRTSNSNKNINRNINNKLNNNSNNSCLSKYFSNKTNNNSDYSNSSIKRNLNYKFFEIKNSQKSKDSYLSKSRSSRNISYKRKKNNNFLNLTKKYKIFHKFLCVSVDTSILYTLDDDISSILLNPKITYNYPYNNSEKELE